MRRSGLLAGVVVVLAAVAARAEDERILSGRRAEDVAYARALVEYDCQELAERFVRVLERATRVGETALRGQWSIRLAAQEAARVRDPIARRDAWIGVGVAAANLLDELDGSPEADHVARGFLDACVRVGEELAFEEELGVELSEEHRFICSRLFERAEKMARRRIKDDESDDVSTVPGWFVRLRGLAARRGSRRRAELLGRAADELDDFVIVGRGVRSYEDFLAIGDWFAASGQIESARGVFDRVIALRESFGPRRPDGRFPIPTAADDIADLVSTATLRTMLLLLNQRRPDEAVAVGEDWFASMPSPHDALSSARIAKALADAKRAAEVR